jgi:hypothetical protein
MGEPYNRQSMVCFVRELKQILKSATSRAGRDPEWRHRLTQRAEDTILQSY